MTNINPIKLTNGAVSGNQKHAENGDVTQNTEQNYQQTANANVQVSGNDVLNFMAAQNAAFVPASGPKTVNVSDYVNAEQKARIEDFMKAFEADFEEISAMTMDEFPELSEGAASEIALAYIDTKY